MSDRNYTPRIGDAFHALVAIDGSIRQARPSPEMEAHLRQKGLIAPSRFSRLPVRTPKGEALIELAVQGVSPAKALEE
jgi:hypothetical protein